MWPFRKRINVYAIIEPKCLELQREMREMRENFLRQNVLTSVDAEVQRVSSEQARLKAYDLTGKVLGMKMAAEMIDAELSR